MKNKKELLPLAVAGLVAAVVAIIISGMIFKPPLKNQTVPTVQKVEASYPDLRNDPNYKSIFNSNALDPTQPVPVGGSRNNSPFSAM